MLERPRASPPSLWAFAVLALAAVALGGGHGVPIGAVLIGAAIGLGLLYLLLSGSRIAWLLWTGLEVVAVLVTVQTAELWPLFLDLLRLGLLLAPSSLLYVWRERRGSSGSGLESRVMPWRENRRER
jgi:hypothetical protein